MTIKTFARPSVHFAVSPLPSGKSALLVTGIVMACALSGCADQPRSSHSSHSKEYFSSSVYGRASERVIADGQPVPKGGGQYLVGRPYSVAGRMYYPSEKDSSYSVTGLASWYGDAFHGRRTANGEIYDKDAITAAHPTMPLPSYVRVTNLRNGRSIIVRVNDRGPYHGGRVMDVSSRVADLLEFKNIGTATIKMDYIGRAEMDGSDDRVLAATLRTDGTPAHMDGMPEAPRTMVAENQDEQPAAPPPPPVSHLPKPIPAPAPIAPPPVRTVYVAPPAQTASAEDEPVSEARPAPPPLRAPLPPSRPFDVGAIKMVVQPPPPKPTLKGKQNGISELLNKQQAGKKKLLPEAKKHSSASL
ncbi:septal ring lytic transglycosylase RlpA family protein [Methylovirgula sp. 4M-Z18]|nr:septal ring lytic transglycosylase RlpA family protein [Methylovirgula sp. 4M-Z18]